MLLGTDWINDKIMDMMMEELTYYILDTSESSPSIIGSTSFARAINATDAYERYTILLFLLSSVH
ncbi:hypothetical protein SERLA73DRAFT_79994 [Serpula lacrymans var. lacrymans S7.3]|uniref:Uncharacterized protein n=2 Tax=Serpula lacrymans var. lacrymans TaxID=341189 RepID=F8QIA0_SERL3|nr:uncharacterized protein SERLADRAFT_431913 [Serpula lacrymans var. lacrymans S7.9]EGN91953.1 hypothetical protein SERLA73DRAFT_79994 [Serpula lacrymans var. lacrymans S7.3]EGO30381.1 hypothetical protein SERLADRAFT_431913 [Serpula lacrymans var. lacrymans S7.9]